MHNSVRYFKSSEGVVYALSPIQTPEPEWSEMLISEVEDYIESQEKKYIPAICTPAQGLVALYATKGITEGDITAAIAAIPDAGQRYIAQIGFLRATTWERSSATMQAMAVLLGLEEQDLDALFVYASGVQV